MAVLTMVEAEAGERTAAMPPIVVEPAKSATLPELMTKLRNERLVYVGETHTAYGDHVLQLDVLVRDGGSRGRARRWRGSGSRRASNRYSMTTWPAGSARRNSCATRNITSAGGSIIACTVRSCVSPGKMVLIIALNADQEPTRDPACRYRRRLGNCGGLPDDYDFSDKTYEELLRGIFDLHQSEDAQFQRFLEVQLTLG